MTHHASRRFWSLYQALPEDVRKMADAKFDLLKRDERHPSLHFKQIGSIWSARVGRNYRVLGHSVPDGVQWFWIGTHAEYDELISE